MDTDDSIASSGQKSLRSETVVRSSILACFRLSGMIRGRWVQEGVEYFLNRIISPKSLQSVNWYLLLIQEVYERLSQNLDAVDN